MATATFNRVIAYVRRLSGVDTLNDRELLERFAQSADEAAFAEVVRRHGPMVLATCRRVLRHEQDAEDAFQAAFLVLARKASSIRQHDSLGGWLHQVAHRLAVRARALAERRSYVFLHDDHAAPTIDPLLIALDEELARLPEAYRAAIVLCYLEGKTQSEAAQLLATTADAVNSRLKRARELLRHRLARPGVVLTLAGLNGLLTSAASEAALSPAVIHRTVRAAVEFITSSTSVGAAASLAKGALANMTAPLKLVAAGLLFLALMTTGIFLMASSADDHPRFANVREPASDAAPLAQKKPDDPKKKQYSCIILWMSGGPSQLDTFDPKPGKVALFNAIDTSVKGIQFSGVFPKLAKQAHHLAIIRSLSHREGDHLRGSYLMRTGYAVGGGVEHPGLGSILAKELGDQRPDVPRYLSLSPFLFLTGASGPGFLGKQYAPIRVGEVGAKDNGLTLPDADVFDEPAKGKGEAHRKAVAKAFDLADETAATRDAYGKNRFGDGCLLARRLIDANVPVVEITLGGWDVHANAVETTKQRGAELDAGLSALLKDLHEKKKLDTTLIVWMGEFGRTPRLNPVRGRDHFPLAFTTMLAGANIKSGQAIGKTSEDGSKVDERPVSPQEFLATIYQALRIDPHKTNRTEGGVAIPLVERGNDPVKEALR